MIKSLKEYKIISQTDHGLKKEVNYNYKFIVIGIIIFFSYSFLYNRNIDISDNKIINKQKKKINHENKLVNENFFIIDSYNLQNVIPHMYGFSISEKGILTDNYYKQLGEYIEPEPLGAYIMVRKKGNKIILNQDFHGSYGMYIFENREENYFALSNSFLLLEEYLLRKQNISLNKDFADNLIITNLCTYSIGETLIREIKEIPSNVFIEIDINQKNYKFYDINYKENSIPLESKEGLKIIDKWVDKWGYILRSLIKQTDNISSDLSGGFDTRTLLSVLLKSGVNLNDILVRSLTDKKHDHDIDYKIANNISSHFGFKLNNKNFDQHYINLTTEDSLLNTLYLKLGFHKEFYIKNKFFSKPRFAFAGSGGESLRGSPRLTIKDFMKKIFSRDILGHEDEFYNSAQKLINRSVLTLKKENVYNNDYEISYALYSKSLGRNHFGKSAIEGFMANFYTIQPLMDPEIRRIKFEINKDSFYDLISYIYVRFGNDLIKFPFQGERVLNLESIKKAESLNKQLEPYKIKSDYNENFFIDTKRISPTPLSKVEKDPYESLMEIFKSSNYINIIKKIYDINVYNWANEYMNKTNYHPLSQHYSLLSIAVSIYCISLNERYMTNINNGNIKVEENIMNKFIKTVLL